MESIEFMVQGSADEPYHVVFTKEGNNLNAYCTCPAGEFGLYCKHRFDILAGKTKAIVSDNIDQAPTVQSWLPGSDIEDALKKLEKAEQEYKRAKKLVSEAKKNVAIAMRT